ncbi:hypothetical protein [Polaromonas sp.]|uniref:hypothetical protein n=1 Tax=Polaromonas sp. TaxID=1869339 RepID=UPI0013B67AE2|nr:hypothetical protein [Polaromonas sp.]NDP62116.1 hypothetical protein [Polaromonas sp.]
MKNFSQHDAVFLMVVKAYSACTKAIFDSKNSAVGGFWQRAFVAAPASLRRPGPWLENGANAWLRYIRNALESAARRRPCHQLIGKKGLFSLPARQLPFERHGLRQNLNFQGCGRCALRGLSPFSQGTHP